MKCCDDGPMHGPLINIKSEREILVNIKSERELVALSLQTKIPFS